MKILSCLPAIDDFRMILCGEAFTWEEIYAAPGAYIVGYLVQDLDGKVYPVYANVTIE